ncbi:MAG TPA: hypothetical protein VMH38_05515 [Thermoplasmata archaeon]|nr:hypothetical protein [Thermoplasmata archaeon]
MVDVDSILLSVQERDKWRKRAEVLERAVRDVRDQRRRLEARLRRVKKELGRLALTVAEEIDYRSRTSVRKDVSLYGTGGPPYR